MSEPAAKKPKGGIWMMTLIISGCCVLIFPLLGLLGTVVGMTSAFGKLGEDASPEGLANDISLSLYTTIFGWLGAAISLVVFIVALVKVLRAKRA